VKKAEDIELLVVGDEEKIKEHLTDSERITVFHTPEVITGDDEPVRAIRMKKNSSMVVGLNMLKNGDGEAFVSAGNSGALISGATLLLKRMKGVRRVSLSPLIPTAKGTMILIDGGANADCTPEMLCQFALMGNVYAKTFLGIENPKIALLNNGAEEIKGNNLARQAHAMLKEMPINFIGNIEARHVLLGNADVVVTDGFSGNILMKTIEGTAMYFSGALKEIFMSSLKNKICALALKDGIVELKNKFDYNEHGGAPVLGAEKPVIKAHGSSKERAFCNAIMQARKFAGSEALEMMKKHLTEDEL